MTEEQKQKIRKKVDQASAALDDFAENFDSADFNAALRYLNQIVDLMGPIEAPGRAKRRGRPRKG